MDNVNAYLRMIYACEGTDGPNGYRMMFGGRLFDSFADHPRQRFSFTDRAGRILTTTAAGAPQFEVATWDRLAKKLGLKDFTPASQDAAAIELIAECGAMSDVKDGNLQAAIDKCASQWASLPASNAQQGPRTYLFATEAFLAAGGSVA